MDSKNKDTLYREFALNENLWRVILKIGIPIAFYQSISFFLKIADTVMASYVGSTSVSAVAFLSQINSLIVALGAGMAVGGSIQISNAYGLGDDILVRKRVGSLFFIMTILSVCALLLIPFSVPFLYFMNTPESLIEIGSRYFTLELLNTVIVFYNTAYIAIERVRGNGKRILFLNLATAVVKFAFAGFFIYVLHSDITMISVSNILAQLFLLAIGIRNLRDKNSIFYLSFKELDMRKKIVLPLVQLSFPISIEKSSFSLGKVIINGMCKQYGALAVGALGVSNNISALVTSPQNGFQEAGAAIISQQVGAGKKHRAIEAFYKIVIINVIIGAIGLLLTLLFVDQLSFLFANSASGFDHEFQQMIIQIYRYESWGGAIPLAFNSAIVALLLGFGYSKLTLLINFFRLFVFRIPVFWLIQHYTTMGYEACGVIMLVSNVLVSLFSIGIAFVMIRKIKKVDTNIQLKN